MDKNQQELFKIILEEVLVGITEKELGNLIDTFVGIYEEKFGIMPFEMDTPETEDVLHVNDASDYLKKFRL